MNEFHNNKALSKIKSELKLDVSALDVPDNLITDSKQKVTYFPKSKS